MKILFLADNESAIPTVAQWYFNEWGYLDECSSLEKVTAYVQQYLNKDKIPLMMMAVTGDQIMGVVQLKYREMAIYPDKEHWLGGVYVGVEYRGNKVAEQIIIQLIKVAQSLGVQTLYLQTEDLSGGLYHRLGWTPVEQVNNKGVDVLVMEKHL